MKIFLTNRVLNIWKNIILEKEKNMQKNFVITLLHCTRNVQNMH